MTKIQEKGKLCVLEMDVQGAETIKKTDLSAYFLFVAPKSLAELEARLRGRYRGPVVSFLVLYMIVVPVDSFD